MDLLLGLARRDAFGLELRDLLLLALLLLLLLLRDLLLLLRVGLGGRGQLDRDQERAVRAGARSPS